MDYASLRREGIQALERMAGDAWTDFNDHDPGVTLLEQLCYALTDLGYRTAYAVPDLLADGGGDPYANLHPPAEILSSYPVTLADLRRVVLDVDGVKNAWVEPLEEDKLPLYYRTGSQELSLTPDPAGSEPVKLKGLYRVLLDIADLWDSDRARGEVARCLHKNRGLCEDFAEIVVMTPHWIKVDVTVEIGKVEDTGLLEREIIQKLADVISPKVPFATLEELLDAGKSVDEIFEGPRLAHGFITAEALERATRRTAINTSDLIHAVMDVPGVRAVSRVRISSPGGPLETWSLAVEPGKVARLYPVDPTGSRITLRREGKIVATHIGGQTAALASPSVAAGGAGLTPPPGRDRSVGKYWSAQQHLPELYGVGELGLKGSAPPARKAQAKQLKAYLMFFDQLMANYLAQLAHVKDLFSYDNSEMRTYFAQALDQPELGFAAIRGDDATHAALLTTLAASPEIGKPPLERKSRFLNHLLARFAEALDVEALPQGKQAFLRRYPRLSSARGAGLDALAPAGPDNVAALTERLKLKLGLVEADGETFALVEHILLRPMDGDDQQSVPLLSAVDREDPYSLQLTFVFPDGAGRFAQDEFKRLVEHTLRAETPAHLTPYVRWMDAADFGAFQAVHAEWLSRRRRYLADRLGVTLEPGA